MAGSSGAVGGALVRLLEGHPAFRLGARMGPPGRGMVSLEAAGPARAVLSALPAAIAQEWEPRWLAEGRWVFSSSGAWPLGEGMPVVPEVNPEQLPPSSGTPARVLAPNCAAHGVALALAPLRPLGLRRACVSTMQALSGAGRRGVPALEGGDNLLPFIEGEEERVEAETAALLGGDLAISAQCHRVPVAHGHAMSLSVELHPGVSREDVLAAWRGLRGLDLPSAPRPPLRYHEAADRPQPRLDRDALGGMQVAIGRLRPCPVLAWKFHVLIHNLIRGAAGALLLNAEAVLLADRTACPRS